MGRYTIHIVINVLHLLDDYGYGCAMGKGTTVLSCTAILFQLVLVLETRRSMLARGVHSL